MDPPFDVRHGVIEAAGGTAGIEERQDMRVLQPSLGADLPLETLHAERGPECRVEHLQRGPASVAEVLRQVDGGTRTSTELFLDQVVSGQLGRQAIVGGGRKCAAVMGSAQSTAGSVNGPCSVKILLAVRCAALQVLQSRADVSRLNRLPPFPAAEDGRVDPTATFIKRFGDLVTLLRVDPGNDAAQDLALSAAAAVVHDRGIDLEAGLAWALIPDDMPLKARMLARQVDRLRIEAGAEAEELQALARALAHDVTPLPLTPNITFDLVRLLAPPEPPAGPPGSGGGGGVSAGGPPSNRRIAEERRQPDERRRQPHGRFHGIERRRGSDRRISGERRLHLLHDQQDRIAQLTDALAWASRTQAWEEALHALHGLVRMEPRVPDGERRMFGVEVRRRLARPTLEGILDVVEQNLGLRESAAEVLRWLGLDAVEVMLDRLRRGEALGIRVFVYNVVGGMPEAYRLVRPMVLSGNSREARHGVAMLARLGVPESVELLSRLVEHPDELVRVAAVHALGELHGAQVAIPLRQALRHPLPRTRAAAAQAVACWRGGELAELLAGAVRDERDRDTWQAMVSALGTIGSPEACGALADIALTGRSLLRRSGYSTGQRLAAVTALALAGSGHGVTTLQRLARDADGVVGYAADRVLQAEGRRAG
jgi:HEAT repeat protein